MHRKISSVLKYRGIPYSLSADIDFHWWVPTTVMMVAEEPAGSLKAPLFVPGNFLEHMHRRYNPVGVAEPSRAPPAPRSFPPKHLNIMDPLLPTNNLGRSVNQASAKRIRLAFRNGASTLEGILAKVHCRGSLAIDKFLARACHVRIWCPIQSPVLT